ncbi:hypothetical protein ACIP98_40405 [Streptomyces sp. NPDC088354]|uniref:hypothetical protein n=1 Tax=Streptomyces sp. NPDC088354 TaxID=3365856 RepID=UPI00381D6F5F
MGRRLDRRSGRRQRDAGPGRDLVSPLTAAAQPASSRLSTEERTWYQDHLGHWLGAGASLCLPPAPHPFRPSAQRAALSRARPRAVDDFFRNCLRVYRAVLDSDLPPVVGSALYGDLPDHHGLGFHRSLGTAAMTVPHSFRTDESLSGKLYEIQVPGSGWGEYLLQADHQAAFHPGAGPDAAAVAGVYAEALRRTLGTPDPALLYLVDTATSQTGVRYFIERTRAAGVRYYGTDAGVGPDDVRHIRSHSLPGLFHEQHPDRHLARAAREPYLYDPSLNAMFFSKITTALPFWRFTRDLFTDQDRDLFPYTAVLEADGVQLPGGDMVSRRAFADVVRTRPYVLKYAGSDVYSGSGGSGICLLDDPSCHDLDLLEKAWDRSANHQSWIVQEAIDACDPAWDEQYPGATGRVPKLSVLCALGSYLGSMVLAGTETIVHAGTSDMLAVCAEVSEAAAVLAHVPLPQSAPGAAPQPATPALPDGTPAEHAGRL